MAFFKKYNGSTNAKMVRLERLIWVLIYGGLLAIVLGLFLGRQSSQDASLFYQFGGLTVLAGVVLIYVRSRLREEN